MVGATSPARDATAIRAFYLDKLGFTPINHGIPARVRMPGDSGQEVDIAVAGADGKSGIQFGVADVKRAAEILKSLGLTVATTGPGTSTAPSTSISLAVTDPDGDVVSFVKAALPDAAALDYFTNWPACRPRKWASAWRRISSPARIKTCNTSFIRKYVPGTAP